MDAHNVMEHSQVAEKLAVPNLLPELDTQLPEAEYSWLGAPNQQYSACLVLHVIALCCPAYHCNMCCHAAKATQ